MDKKWGRSQPREKRRKEKNPQSGFLLSTKNSLPYIKIPLYPVIISEF